RLAGNPGVDDALGPIQGGGHLDRQVLTGFILETMDGKASQGCAGEQQQAGQGSDQLLLETENHDAPCRLGNGWCIRASVIRELLEPPWLYAPDYSGGMADCHHPDERCMGGVRRDTRRSISR